MMALLACRKEAEPAAPPPMTVQVAKATRGDVAEVVEVSGELGAPPGLDVKLGPLVAGRLGTVLVAEGDRVREGQVLARMDATPLRDSVSQGHAQVEQARAQEQNAKAKLERAVKALDAGVAAAQEVDDGRLALAQAQAQARTAAAALSTARNQLGRSELRAPFAGVVAHVFAAAGEPVDANKPVIEVARLDTVELRAPLAPQLAARVRAGQEAQMTADALPERTFSARVIAVAPMVDPATGAALVRLRCDNSDGALRLGTFAHARIVIDVRRGVIRVPQAALLTGEGGAAVEVVDAGKAVRAPVQVVARDGQWAGITGGLKEGADVIVQGNYALPDGTPVQAEKREEDAVTPDAGASR
ncbi:MAG TPA: efflux RND transporter periplasmic adaptor subunit [Myxococcales bacterium]|jgi:membrane fusion protein (multidrug efflux system)|nr:efflux RND transporter periplasmic adaptor subunit [Myxococcales bacterium]